ncbi:MAG: ATP-binding cassette domain-containing protein, partial [Ruminiclostridium sp.]|nr:ATP-binding cassette domain-containing protein [Ruminiclostridium sp.]
MLEIRNLHKSYKNFNVLNGLYMTINRGDIYGFLGKNGCGKTTTMNIICSILPKDDGEIILGEDGTNRIKIGYLPDTPSLFQYMNGYEYLGYIAYCCKYKDDVNKRIGEVLELTG